MDQPEVISYRSPTTTAPSPAPVPLVGTTKEKTFYTDAEVLVTDKRVIVGSVSYSMAGLTAVQVRTLKPSARLVGYSATGSAIFLLFGMLTIGQRHTNPSPAFLSIGALLAAIAAFELFRRNRKHAVTISTASSEANILVDKDRNRVSSIVQAINLAFMER